MASGKAPAAHATASSEATLPVLSGKEHFEATVRNIAKADTCKMTICQLEGASALKKPR